MCIADQISIYFLDFFPFFSGINALLMFGNTPALAMVTALNKFDNSSSLRTANMMCRGTIRCFLLSFAALPANSNNSAVKYSKTDAKYTGAPPPTRFAYPPRRKYRAIRPTGNCKPARDDRDCCPDLPFPPFPFPFPLFETGMMIDKLI